VLCARPGGGQNQHTSRRAKRATTTMRSRGRAGTTEVKAFGQRSAGRGRAEGTAASLAAKAATTTIPIVFDTAADPVRVGLIASLNRPGGNITGVAQLTVGIVPKELQFLHDMIPAAHIVALLVNPTDPVLADTVSKEILSAAPILGLEVHILNANSERDFKAVFANVTQLHAGGLVIGTDPLFTGHSNELAALAMQHRVAAVYKGLEFAAAGGLLSYGVDINKDFHLVGTYAGRILKGDKPADLPVQQATEIEMVVNLKTAKALGIAVPLMLLGRADKIIE
jgi:putative ABC transport system substrate-binding protein